MAINCQKIICQFSPRIHQRKYQPDVSILILEILLPNKNFLTG